MADNTIMITKDQLRQIARYELTFKEILGEADFDEADISCPEIYSYSLEDLYQALQNLKKADPTVHNFGEYWFYPVWQLAESFDLDRARGLETDDEEVQDHSEISDEFPGLLLNDDEYFQNLWWEMENTWEDCYDENHLSEVWDFDEMLADFDRYLSNREKPIEERKFSLKEIEDFIGFYYDDGDYLKNASERTLALVRKFTDKLCSPDIYNHTALRLKGYACYGGSRLYPCDWNVSRDCITRLFDNEDDPYFANTLGYIYYYGRCTGGVPEYDKAFHYFGIAAANGLYEGMYKLADMFFHGYGCKQSSCTARALYGMVYEDSLKNFLNGKFASFADAALRMGNVYFRGIGEKADIERAWCYYVQADYAARLRAKKSEFFGAATVVIKLQNTMDELRQQLPEDYFHEYEDCEVPYLFNKLTEKNNRCNLTVSRKEDGIVELTSERIKTRTMPDPEYILVTIPEMSFCERTKKVSYTLDETAKVWVKDEAEHVRFDYCGWNETECRYEFRYDDDLVAWVRSNHFRFYGSPAAEPFGPEYRLATVRFSASGRTYDYICGDESVQEDDRVIVNGYDGETEVTVIKVITRHESELALPVERYKKILRKV